MGEKEGDIREYLALRHGATFDPPLLFREAQLLVGRNATGDSPHDFLQSVIRFDGGSEIEFDDLRGIIGSAELDMMISECMLAPAMKKGSPQG